MHKAKSPSIEPAMDKPLHKQQAHFPPYIFLRPEVTSFSLANSLPSQCANPTKKPNSNRKYGSIIFCIQLLLIIMTIYVAIF